MDEIQATKSEIRSDMIRVMDALQETQKETKTKKIEDRLFEFANFLESKIILLYMNNISEVSSGNIIKRCFKYNKIVVLPAFDNENYQMKLLKIDTLDNSLIKGPRGVKEPDPNQCKLVPIDRIDIAIIPGIALDEKGGRIGTGEGYYDRFIPKLPVTTRKVALAFEDQIVPHIPTESHDKYVDIIITDKRIIYKI